ncbi:MAG: sigma-54-dependent Fis family transcriptional regulator [Phycisphaeraceae bacterium]|nr:sigma-54-dependent Fis family transcriptional regulator [Phycisphaeraceae bacterium]
MKPARVLVVDDDAVVRESIAGLLRAEGHEAECAASGQDAQSVLDEAMADRREFDVVICDVVMPGMSGMDLLRWIRRQHPATATVLLTGYGSIESAVEALRLGASDYLTKPVLDAELRCSIERAMRERMLLSENRRLRASLDAGEALEGIVGTDPRMREVFRLVEAVAPSRTTVLMTGESGTGKSLVARAIHQRSDRRDGPFVELACGSIPEPLLESELFGHVRGAFTGAHADKPGKFEAAHGGTIFLDEINSASPGMQLKLLRVLQERTFEPVGSSETREADVRVLLAGNQPLEELVARGEFRQDLYYRINVVTIELPALRERIADIPALAERFLVEFASDLGRQIVGFTPEAVEAMRRYRWPGNVRELRNAIERGAVLTRGQTIGVDDLPPAVAGDGPLVPTPPAAEAFRPMPLEEAMRGPERRVILGTLKACGWNRTRAAQTLGINRTTLYKRMRSLDIDLTRDRRVDASVEG